MDRSRIINARSSAGGVHSHPEILYLTSRKDAPLPPVLRNRVPGPLHYSVTSHAEHQPKPVDDVLRNVIYPKASPHWHTLSLNGLAQKLQASRSVRLVSAPPVSEMQEQYRGRSAPYEPLEHHYRTLRALHGQTSARLQREAPLSTTHNDYRHFSRFAWTPPSTSLNRGPVPEHSELIPQAPPVQLRLLRRSIPVPYGGRRSVYTDSFGPPASPTRVLAWAERKGPDLLQHVLGVPEMYSTENKTYGAGRIVLV